MTSEGTYSDMWVAPQDDPRTLDEIPAHDELSAIREVLRYHRLTLVMKCDGLSDAQMAQRPISSSTMSLLGLVRHMAYVESQWFRRVLSGDDSSLPFTRADDRDFDFHAAVGTRECVEEAWRVWREETGFAERYALRVTDLGATVPLGDRQVSVREVLLHMIEEYAQHNGHADILRECIDGRTGQ